MIYMKELKCRECGHNRPYKLVGDTREEQMYDLIYEQGFTLRQIAKPLFDISAQRVQQILKRYINYKL